jgi:hypothetical protein
MVMTSLSPRTTVLNQMLAFCLSTTEPMTVALSAMNQSCAVKFDPAVAKRIKHRVLLNEGDRLEKN